MIRSIALQNALGEWPPMNAAATGESPTIGPTDIIIAARVSSTGHLVLNLQRNGLRFTSSVPVPSEFISALAALMDDIIGKTIREAGRLNLNLHSQQDTPPPPPPSRRP